MDFLLRDRVCSKYDALIDIIRNWTDASSCGALEMSPRLLKYSFSFLKVEHRISAELRDICCTIEILMIAIESDRLREY